ncbi:hypothetical protein AGMMS49992_21980 [Clostridia bacterium]|nr:hypothetical protein AGMMS49992_21980 [Clostridia bacterium]
MPTNKPRITFALSDYEMEIVNRFMDANGITNQSSAVRAIMSMGIKEFNVTTTKGKHRRFDLPDDAAQLVDDYMMLNPKGKGLVRQVVEAATELYVEQPEPLSR